MFLFSAKFMQKIASRAVLFAVGITPYSMDSKNESYNKFKQTQIVLAQFLFNSLIAFFIVMATGKPL